ncbi:MAG TPA: CHAD domain-containing protein [Caulobacteraceae bacterium]|nr:CHAD domain-containing protein [Caulobacteraceae bacterium]
MTNPAPSEPREIELKFALEPGESPEILRFLGAAETPETRLDAVYFDTRGLALRERGLSLRLRREDGKVVQTLKQRQEGGGAFGRAQWEASVEATGIDRRALRGTPAAEALLGLGSPLPLVDVTTRRTRVMIEGDAEAKIEVSVDRGQAAAAGRSSDFEELELELKSGSPEGLFAYAGPLQSRFDLELSFIAKADRGFALLDEAALTAEKFHAAAISADATAGEAFRAFVREALEHLARNARLFRSSPEPEAVHQMRVGARRLRAIIETFGKVARDDRRQVLDDELRWFGKELDAARDLDVFLGGAWRRAERGARRASETAATATDVRRRLETARVAAYARAGAAAASPRLRRLFFDLLAWAEVGAWTSPGAPGARRRDRTAAAFARKRLASARRRLVDAGEGLAQLSAPRRHKVRIRAKQVRYAAEAFAPLFGGREGSHDFIARLKALQDDLGALNDIAVAKAIAGDYPPAGKLIGRQKRREKALLASAAHHLAAFAKAQKFWKTARPQPASAQGVAAQR